MNILIAFILICSHFTLILGFPSHPELEIREVLEDTESQAKFLLEVDLASCTCLDRSDADECDIAIFKSSVLEITCTTQEIYCCNGRTRHDAQTLQNGTLSNPSSDGSESRSNKDGIYTLEPEEPLRYRLVPILETLEALDHPTPSKKEPKEPTTQQGKKCMCKPREQCPTKYVDYRFGFHCSYNTTRCCEPESETDTYKTPISEYQPYNIDDNPKETEKSEKCLCLPKEDCSDTSESDNAIIRRRQDTLCPGVLVQCCGSRIRDSAKETYNYDDTYDSEDRETSEPDNDNQKDIQDGFEQQPIPLPELKIPETEAEDENYSVSTLAPPKLPTYYNYQSPEHYSGYFYPQSTYAYQPNYALDNPDSSGNDRPRYFDQHRESYAQVPLEQPRAFSDDTILGKITKLLG